ncbi:ABC transporter ATP-binding protein [Enterovirga rhinocerotis]|uniref:Amino acid/amide ABC transporter ATP-binding protein 2 (HAAT family) n=1 Tax=Enterovirga rhinocerotis TaxID=1339210 RepID=A0A4R7C4N7_9HYPH|nr:ABC transporter ATP-binding protein [Enterovirga rhinocerotis]TDR92983.1 amino acid/amide ABC transporter ATP-binding protein 2 (HAAT family) [Enterovirga rhinocerotis]
MLTVRNLSVRFGDVLALEDFSFDVGPGQVVGIVGSNGAGKTTTLSAISGLVARHEGSVTFDGEAIDRLTAHAIVERGLIHVPEGRRLFPFMTVQENLELGAYPRAARAKREQQLDFVFSLLPKLKERRGQQAVTLSGGEQQMCAIGRGLMSCPRLLLLDEPTLGLAPLLVEEVFALVRSIRETGVPVLIVEQQVVHALQSADHAYVLESGACVMRGEGHALLANDALRRAYLGV